MAKTVTKVGVSIETELLLDIYFYLTKVKGNTEPQNSLGKFISEKLRPIVPKRNIQVSNHSKKLDDSE